MYRKNKTIYFFGLLAFINIGLIIMSPRAQAPNQKSPINTPSTASNASKKPNQTPHYKSTDPSKSWQQLAKNSPTLKAYPNAPEIPYYLLGNVNDPYYSNNWSFSKVQADRAWDLSTGSSTVTIAVIDTGFALNHEDLTGKWATNAGEMGNTQSGDGCWTGTPADKKTNNCDDDKNGYTDDWRGFDFYNVDNSAQAGEVTVDGEGTQHATMVSGVIAATANNAIGSTGIDQNAKIMPLQVFSDDAAAYTSDIVAAVDYATDNGADIINMSLGANQYDATLRSAIQRAISNGVLVVAASGNCALNDDPICYDLTAPGRMTYPALYSEVLSVGSTTQSGTRASFSSYGPELDLVAPGDSVGPMPIYASDGKINQYAIASGTSFSAPLVAGVAALLKAQNPSLNPDQLDEIITFSADKLSDMNNKNYAYEYGTGQANAHKATLLGLAKTQTNFLGLDTLSPRQPAIGHVWRAAVGNINSDEYVLIGCRVASASICSASVENGSVYPFTATSGGEKADALQYIFIKGNAVPSGTWHISVHNNEYASYVTYLLR